ncbi:MAG: hypothetical protein JWL77_5644 [Chthonomonadaceae bacterium]|nr:hypothetical protein [Chthonomonadaceae bacterium]
MKFALKYRIACSLAVAALAGPLTGCGGSSGTSGPGGAAVDALTNPDHVLFGSGRAQDASWHFYAMNPDGSGVVPVSSLNSLNALLCEGVSLNQTGTFATLTFDDGSQPGPGPEVERRLVRLSDGATLLAVTMPTADPQTVFAVNSSGSQAAIAGSPASTDPYAIYLMAPDGTQKTRISAIPTGTTVSEISFAPDGTTLYFVALAGSAGAPFPAALYKLTLEASSPTLVANISVPLRSLHISRDGKQLAFVSVAEASDLHSATITPYALRTDGSGLTKGAAIAINEPFPVWNAVIASRADGFHLLYAISVDGAKEIFDVRTDGSGRTQITFNAAGNTGPGSRQAAMTGVLRSLGGR